MKYRFGIFGINISRLIKSVASSTDSEDSLTLLPMLLSNHSSCQFPRQLESIISTTYSVRTNTLVSFSRVSSDGKWRNNLE